MSGLVIPTINILKPPPGTKLYERMVKEQRIIRKFSFDDQLTNIKTILSEQELYSGYRQLLRYICSPAGIFKRSKIFLQNYKGQKTRVSLKRKLELNTFKIFIRTIFKLGILGKDQLHFWKFLLWGAKNYPKKIGFIFLFSVQLRQLRLYYENFNHSLKQNKII